jgi:hypothetical protein
MGKFEKRLGALEGAELEEGVEKRLEEELTDMFELLEERLDRETFIRVARILAHADKRM